MFSCQEIGLIQAADAGAFVSQDDAGILIPYDEVFLPESIDESRYICRPMDGHPSFKTDIFGMELSIM